MSNDMWKDPATGRTQPYKVVGGAAKPTYHDEDVYEQLRPLRSQRLPPPYDGNVMDTQYVPMRRTDEEISATIDELRERVPSVRGDTGAGLAPDPRLTPSSGGEPVTTRRTNRRIGGAYIYRDEA